MKKGPKPIYTPEEAKARHAARVRKWRAAHPEKCKQYTTKSRKYHREYYHLYKIKNKDRINSLARKNGLKKSISNKKSIVEMFGGKCIKCGYNKCIQALEFHHREGEAKLFEVSGERLRKKKLSQLIEEARKCDLTCANCHREIHYGLGTTTSYNNI